MDNPSTLRRKAAHFFKSAASATPTEAEKLNEVGRQLELWADDLEEMLTYQSKTLIHRHPARRLGRTNQLVSADRSLLLAMLITVAHPPQ